MMSGIVGAVSDASRTSRCTAATSVAPGATSSSAPQPSAARGIEPQRTPSGSSHFCAAYAALPSSGKSSCTVGPSSPSAPAPPPRGPSPGTGQPRLHHLHRARQQQEGFVARRVELNDQLRQAVEQPLLARRHRRRRVLKAVGQRRAAPRPPRAGRRRRRAERWMAVDVARVHDAPTASAEPRAAGRRPR